MFAAFRQPAATIPLILTPRYRTVGIKYAFPAGFTRNVTLRCNGKQEHWLKFNSTANAHFGTIGVSEGTLCNLELIDEKGALRTASTTSLTTPTIPAPTRTRWVSPDVGVGSGDLDDEFNPGNVTDAITNLVVGDRIMFYEGTKPYNMADDTISTNNVTFLAVSGENPVISGARKTAISWTNETGGIYSTTDYDANCKQVHAIISSKVERFQNRTDLTALQAADHGWTIDTGKLYVKLSLDPLSTVSVDPATTTVYLGDTNRNLLTVFSDNFWCEGLIFEHVGATPLSTARALIVNGDNFVCKDCTFRHIYQIGLRITIVDGFLVDGCSFVEHNDYLTFDEIKSGPLPTEAATQLNISGCSNGTVRNCSFLGSMDLLALNDIDDSIEEINIYENTFTNGRGETFDISGTVSQIRRWKNTLINPHSAISLATGFGGPVWILNEKCYGVGYIGPVDADNLPFSTASGASKFNSVTTGAVAQLVIVNNTLQQDFGDNTYYPNTRCWFVDNGASNDFPMSDCYMHNNIFSTFGRPFEDQNTTGTYSIDHNLYWSTNTYSYVTLFGWRSGLLATDFAAFQLLSNQEDNGEFTDPVLTLGVPATPIPGEFIPGITGNISFGVTLANKGSQ